MTRSSTSELLHLYSKPEHKLFKKPKKEKNLKIMEDDQPMWSIRQKAPETPVSEIIKPTIQGENFEIKRQILHMIRDLQFEGKYDTFHVNGHRLKIYQEDIKETERENLTLYGTEN